MSTLSDPDFIAHMRDVYKNPGVGGGDRDNVLRLCDLAEAGMKAQDDPMSPYDALTLRSILTVLRDPSVRQIAIEHFSLEPLNMFIDQLSATLGEREKEEASWTGDDAPPSP